MIELFLCGTLIGLIISFPVGAVGALTVQRTSNEGVKSGLLTGLGSSVADCLYACVGIFGLTFILDFLLKYQMFIDIIGGCIIIIMGIQTIRKCNEPVKQSFLAFNGAKIFFSSFFITITNPVAVIAFLFAFSYFNISNAIDIFSKILVVIGVLIGTYIWWIILVGVTYILKKHAKSYRADLMNKIFGTILIALGVIVTVKAFFI